MADDDRELHDRAPSWQMDDVPPAQDRIPAQQDQIPQQHDSVPPRTETKQPRRWRLRPARRQQISKGGIARYVLVGGIILATLILGAVYPVRLVEHGWHTASHLRGVGAGRGVFTVAGCADPQQDSNQATFWDCTGTFTATGAAPFLAEAYDYNNDHAGKQVKAYEDADGSVGLDDPSRAAVLFDTWAGIALAVTFVELCICVEMSLWILGKMELAEALGAIGLLSLLGLAIAFVAWFIGLIPAEIAFALLG